VPLAGTLLTTSGFAAADADLDQKIRNPDDWAAQAGDYANHRWSDLKQVNANNVGKLQVAWTMSTGVLRGHEGSPLVIGDMLYMQTPFPNNVYAVSLKDQTFKWKYEPKQDADVVPVMCCDTVNRGLAYGDGKIFLQQADTTLVALDAKTGKVVWSQKNGNPKIGETNHVCMNYEPFQIEYTAGQPYVGATLSMFPAMRVFMASFPVVSEAGTSFIVWLFPLERMKYMLVVRARAM